MTGGPDKTKKSSDKPICIGLLLLFRHLTHDGHTTNHSRPRGENGYFPWCSSETVNFLRPWARREANTRRPFFVAIRSRKPCLFTRRRLCGWNVLFIVLFFYLFVIIHAFGLQNYSLFFKRQRVTPFLGSFFRFFSLKRHQTKRSPHRKSRHMGILRYRTHKKNGEECRFMSDFQ